MDGICVSNRASGHDARMTCVMKAGASTALPFIQLGGGGDAVVDRSEQVDSRIGPTHLNTHLLLFKPRVTSRLSARCREVSEGSIYSLWMVGVAQSGPHYSHIVFGTWTWREERRTEAGEVDITTNTISPITTHIESSRSVSIASTSSFDSICKARLIWMKAECGRRDTSRPVFQPIRCQRRIFDHYCSAAPLLDDVNVWQMYVIMYYLKCIKNKN